MTTTAAAPITELNDVRLAFDKEEVLSGVDLRLAPRERLVILGQSGGGKSTLLRLILGILKPTAGSVQFEGQEVTRMGRRRLKLFRCASASAWSIRHSALISSLSVRDNLALQLEELTDKSRNEINEIVMQKSSRSSAWRRRVTRCRPNSAGACASASAWPVASSWTPN